MPAQKELLTELRELLNREGFYLAGGTALTLYYSHRISEDLDFFVREKFEPDILESKLRATLKNIKVISKAEGTLHVVFRGIRLSFFHFPYPLLEPLRSINGVPTASVRDVAVMKMNAISRRGTAKDFIDLYTIMIRESLSLKELIEITKQKLGDISSVHLLKSLVYFKDAEPFLKGLRMTTPVSWDDVVKFFQDRVRKIESADY